MARRPATRMGKSEGGGGERPRRSGRVPIPPKKSPLPLILGIGGGVLVLLIIIIAVAVSGGGGPAQPKKTTKEPIRVSHNMDRKNTGRIMFICNGSGGKHEEKEVFLDECTSCRRPSTFFWNDQHRSYVCYSCSYVFDRDQVKCPECGKVPKNTRIRPKR